MDRRGAAAGGAQAAALIGRLMASEGACVWIGPRRTVYPPGLKAYGIEPDRVVFVDVRNEKEGLWAVEEALKCEGLAAVVGEIRDVSFLASRRFQLAVEQSRVTGFLLRDRPRNRQPIATVARWQITPLPGGTEAQGMPGVGFARWIVELLRIRGGEPGKVGNGVAGRKVSFDRYTGAQMEGRRAKTKNRIKWPNDTYRSGSAI